MPSSSSSSSSSSIPETTLDAEEQIMAERNQREKLRQGLIPLSAIVPGGKKINKAPIFADVIKQIRKLQERVKILEEQITKKTVLESATLVKKSHRVPFDDGCINSSCDHENFDDQFNSSLPEIKATTSDDNEKILINILYEKQQCGIVKIFNAIQNQLQLPIINCCVLPVGSSTIHITIIAQIDPEMRTSVKDVVENLSLALLGGASN